jgi:hypothetical protein
MPVDQPAGGSAGGRRPVQGWSGQASCAPGAASRTLAQPATSAAQPAVRPAPNGRLVQRVVFPAPRDSWWTSAQINQFTEHAVLHDHQYIPATHWSRLRYVITGGLILGVADLSFAMSFWGIRNGVPPDRVLRSVARGVLGTPALQGGAGTAALGAALHFFIAMSMATIYYAVSQRYEGLTRRPLACGLGYGAVLYLMMHFVVLPLSAAGMPNFSNTLWIVLSVIMHGVFGVICAVAAQRANAASPARVTARR